MNRMDLGAEQALTLRRLKTASPPTCVPILGPADEVLGSLVPITAEMAQDHAILGDLCRWRAANMTSFFTVFEPTVQKTQGFLLGLSLPDPARILFLIQDPAGRRVGNIGLCNVTGNDAEFDNVLRGEFVDHPKFMRFVQWSLAAWAFDTLGIGVAYLSVLADNARAIRSYEGAGFTIVDRTPLVRKPFSGGYSLVPATPGVREDAALVRMEMDRASLRQSRAVP